MLDQFLRKEYFPKTLRGSTVSIRLHFTTYELKMKQIYEWTPLP